MAAESCDVVSANLPWYQTVSTQLEAAQLRFSRHHLILSPLSVLNPNIHTDYISSCLFVCLFFWRDIPQWARASSFTRFLDHTQRRTTVGRTPLDEWSARRRDLYLTTHNTHNRQISMPPVGFEPIISAGERPKTYALDRAATGIGILVLRNGY